MGSKRRNTVLIIKYNHAQPWLRTKGQNKAYNKLMKLMAKELKAGKQIDFCYASEVISMKISE